MKWSLQQLNKYTSESLIFTEEYDFSEDAKNVNGVISIGKTVVEGSCKCIGMEKYKFDLHIEVVLELEDAWTLEPVSYKIVLDVTEIFDRLESSEDVRVIDKNTVDLYDVIWENILLEIPMRITKEEAKEVN